MKNRIAIDLGGTKTEVLLSGENPLDEIIRKRVPTGQEFGYEHILTQTTDLIQEVRQKCSSPPKIGIGIPGTISPKNGLIKNSNSQCLIGQPFQKDLEQILKQAVVMENDANCFALAEATYGAGQGKELVLGIIMGTGMGGGIIHQGKIWKGKSGIGGEWGHSTVNFQGPQCWCGRRGCLEAYLSGPAIEAHYLELAGKQLPLAAIYQDWERGEVIAREVLDEMLMIFGEGLANLICSFDPDLVVIGGGVSNLPILYQEGVKEVEKRLFDEGLTTPIVQNQLGDSAGIYGAALLADALEG